MIFTIVIGSWRQTCGLIWITQISSGGGARFVSSRMGGLRLNSPSQQKVLRVSTALNSGGTAAEAMMSSYSIPSPLTAHP